MRFLVVLALLLGAVAFAAPVQKANVASKFKIDKTAKQKEITLIDAAKIETLVKDFYIDKNQKSQILAQDVFQSMSVKGFRPRPDDDCRPPRRGTDCLDAACDKLGEFGCNEQSEVDSVISACRGVDGCCLDVVCTKLGQFGCNEISEINSVAAVCRKVFDKECMDVVCTKLGEFGCNEISEVQAVGRICEGRVDAGCIESVCTRLGQFGCNEISEVQAVAKSCSGR